MPKLRTRFILHAGVVADIAATIVLSVRRSAIESLGRGAVAPQNLPLAILVLIVVSSSEFLYERLDNLDLILFTLGGFVFLRCSFYLPPVGISSDSYALLSYGALVFQLSMVITAIAWKPTTLLRVIAVSVLVVFAGTAASFAYTYSFAGTRQIDPHAEAAVVLGTTVYGKHRPSPLLQGRLDAALRIFRAGIVKRIVVTGAGQAPVEAWYLHSKGVPDSDIVAEDGTYCTCQQANYIKRVVMDSLEINNLLVITDAWHLPRALLMCRWQGVNAKGFASAYRLPLKSSLFYRVREAGGLQVYILFGA